MSKNGKHRIVVGVNRACKECLCSVNTEQLIDKLTQPKRRRKNASLLYVERKMVRTSKPVCTSKGIHNPVKLNISTDTLNKIKK